MAIVYLAIGGMFVFTHVFPQIHNNRSLVGAVFLVYGTFRLITGILKFKRFRSGNDHE
jgi:hypothetical protein